MNKNIGLLMMLLAGGSCIATAQLTPPVQLTPSIKYKVHTAQKPTAIKSTSITKVSATKTKSMLGQSPAIFPNTNPIKQQVVYEYIDTTFPNSENQFPLNGNAGIGT